MHLIRKGTPFGIVIVVIVIVAIVVIRMLPAVPLLASAPSGETFWKAESPSTLALAYRLRATMNGWQLQEWTADTLHFSSPPRPESPSSRLTCQLVNRMTIKLIPAAQSGTLVTILVTGENRFACPDLG